MQEDLAGKKKSPLLSNESSDYDDYSVITSAELSLTWYQLPKLWRGTSRGGVVITINTCNRDKSVQVHILISDPTTITTPCHI